MSFKLPDLPYAYDALEPHIDAKTMEFTIRVITKDIPII